MFPRVSIFEYLYTKSHSLSLFEYFVLPPVAKDRKVHHHFSGVHRHNSYRNLKSNYVHNWEFVLVIGILEVQLHIIHESLPEKRKISPSAKHEDQI